MLWSSSQSEQIFSKRAKLAVLNRLEVCFFKNKVGSVGNFNHATTCCPILTTVCITVECPTINHSDARFQTTAIAVNSTVNEWKVHGSQHFLVISDVTTKLDGNRGKNKHNRGRPVEQSIFLNY